MGKNNKMLHKSIFFSMKNGYYIYPLVCMNDVHATGEAFSPQKGHPTLIFYLIFFRRPFFTPEPDPADQNPPGSRTALQGAGKIEKIIELTCPEQFRAPWTVRDGPRLP
jgi:hypothetical protein